MILIFRFLFFQFLFGPCAAALNVVSGTKLRSSSKRAAAFFDYFCVLRRRRRHRRRQRHHHRHSLFSPAPSSPHAPALSINLLSRAFNPSRYLKRLTKPTTTGDPRPLCRRRQARCCRLRCRLGSQRSRLRRRVRGREAERQGPEAHFRGPQARQRRPRPHLGD